MARCVPGWEKENRGKIKKKKEKKDGRLRAWVGEKEKRQKKRPAAWLGGRKKREGGKKKIQW
jgi:hypothetical protein